MFSISNSIVILIITLCFFLLLVRLSKANKHKNSKTLPSNNGWDASSCRLPGDPSEVKLYLSALERLGDFFHVQFGTSVQCIANHKVDPLHFDAVIDILLLDKQTLKPKLAVFLTAGGLVWMTNSNRQLESAKALSDSGVHVITLTRQDYYDANKLVTEILDTLDASPDNDGLSFYNFKND